MRGWTLGGRRRFRSILNYENSNPAVSPAFNTGCVPGASVTTGSCTQPVGHWSSTGVQGGSANGRGVIFGGGGFDFILSKGETHAVRAVRGGIIE